jgi:hypothetical protein
MAVGTIIRFFAFPNFIFIPSPLSFGVFKVARIPHQLHRLLNLLVTIFSANKVSLTVRSSSNVPSSIPVNFP